MDPHPWQRLLDDESGLAAVRSNHEDRFRFPSATSRTDSGPGPSRSDNSSRERTYAATLSFERISYAYPVMVYARLHPFGRTSSTIRRPRDRVRSRPLSPTIGGDARLCTSDRRDRAGLARCEAGAPCARPGRSAARARGRRWEPEPRLHRAGRPGAPRRRPEAVAAVGARPRRELAADPRACAP